MGFDTNNWGSQLGLVSNPLFGPDDLRPLEGDHFALLDGVDASFILSAAEGGHISSERAAEWAWSANVQNHVSVSDGLIRVTTVGAEKGTQQFTLTSVESRLEEFLRYLRKDRRAAKISIVEHFVDIFHKFRIYLRDQSLSITTGDTTQVFLILLAARARGLAPDTPIASLKDIATEYGLSGDLIDALPSASDALFRLASHLEPTERSLLTPHLGISVRHAGGIIFQESTAALRRWSQASLLGLPDGEVTPPINVLGSFFTPPGLARTLTEYCVAGRLTRKELVIYDPACGSGVFLSEIIRTLSRHNFKGKVKVVGRDVSFDAISIARFCVNSARRDWLRSDIEVDISQSDTLKTSEIIAADIVLMNPPFRSWEALDEEERSLLKTSLGDLYRGRPDQSLAFVLHALDRLKPDGVLATLIPVGALSSESAQGWRKRISEYGIVKFVSVLGDHAIFRYATVNVGSLLIDRSKVGSDSEMTQVLWASEDPSSSAAALRELRKSNFATGSRSLHSPGWSLYEIPANEFVSRSSWVPKPNSVAGLIADLRAAGLQTVGRLFRVYQGVRTGLRRAFILSSDDLAKLPEKERSAFRPVAEKELISQFEIRKEYFVFYPKDLPKSEAAMRSRFPEYFKKYIQPNMPELKSRKGVDLPWQLTRSRSWLRQNEPRIVSRMFGGPGAFALDMSGEFAIVQGCAWIPKLSELGIGRALEEKKLALRAYCMLFNSRLFFTLVREFSVNVAGGQLDLSPRYVKDVPLPRWKQMQQNVPNLLESNASEYLSNIVETYRKDPEAIEDFAVRAYGLSQKVMASLSRDAF